MSVLDTFSMSGKVSVVTGANRGIGRALAVALAEAGSDVVLLVRDADGTATLVTELETLGITALAVTADVTRPDEVQRALEEVLDRLGQVDVLVNNAGTCVHRPALEVTADEWRHVQQVNVDGVWHCAQTFGRQMVAQRRGVIVNIGSISAQIVNRPQWQPGYVKTEMAPVDEPQFRQHWIEDAPMRRYAVPAELGPSVVYLASDASSFMTGSVLVVDGGYTLF